MEEFSGGSKSASLPAKQSERSHRLGTNRRKERSLLRVCVKDTKRSNRGGVMAIDPVCGMTVDDKKPEFHAMFAGKKYSFCSEECRREFVETPEDFVETAA